MVVLFKSTGRYKEEPSSSRDTLLIKREELMYIWQDQEVFVCKLCLYDGEGHMTYSFHS